MALISSPIPNLVGGVSQQPPALRLSTTCERMENAWPSIVSGLMKRPATEHVANTGLNLAGGGAAGYLIERDDTYRYSVIITNGDLKVIDLNTGSQQTVDFPDGKTYLNAASPVDSFRFVTFGDFTFVSNRNVTVTKSSPADGRSNPNTRGYIYVTQSQYNTYYTVYVNGVLRASYLSPSGASGSAAALDTGRIAEDLGNQLAAAGYAVSRTGSTICITNLGTNDSLTVQGGSGDKSLRSFRTKVQSFSELPPNAPEGSIVRVAGDLEELGDDYYVIYNKGVWEETYGYGAREQLDEATMPHVLVRESDGTWTFERHYWIERPAGDADGNQTPSFVGNKINDIFVYTNRLGLLADENVILSESDNFENFYRTTTAQVLDSDRIDIAVLHNDVDILYHAAAFNNDLLLLSQQNQFRLSFAQFLGPKNVQVKYTTSFNVSPRIRPINMGNSLYFVDDRPDYSYTKLWEYYPKENVTADDAEDVTAPIPEYVPNDVKFIAGSNRAGAVVVQSGAAQNVLYLYKYFWAIDKKVQTSWSKWILPDATKVHWGAFSGTFLYLLVERATGTGTSSVFLERVRFDEDVFDTQNNYNILLDRRTSSVTTSYDAVNDRTTIVLPYSTTAPVVEVIGSGGPEAVSGYRHTVTKLANNELAIPGNMTAQTLTVGIPYTFLFEFSPVYVRQAKGQGEIVVLDGRLQVRYISLEYHDTAYFQTTLELPGRNPFVGTFSGRVMGGLLSSLGSQSFASGVYRIPVMSKNTDVKLTLTNDTPFPSAFGSAEWQGEYVMKSRKRL